MDPLFADLPENTLSGMTKLNTGFRGRQWTAIQAVLDSIVQLLHETRAVKEWANSVSSPLEGVWGHQPLPTQEGILSRLDQSRSALERMSDSNRRNPHVVFEGSITLALLADARRAAVRERAKLRPEDLLDFFETEEGRIQAMSPACKKTIQPTVTLIYEQWEHLSHDQRVLAVEIFERTYQQVDAVLETGIVTRELLQHWIPNVTKILQAIDSAGDKVFERYMRVNARSLAHFGPSRRQRQIYRLPPV
ncbi:hypothetical protein JCM10212_003132 [Sporobolomyces blumeae]